MKDIITCPKCKAQYLLGEIFIPECVIGQPKNIKKDEKGKLEFYSGVHSDNVEYYKCDYCDNTFKVTVDLQTKVEMNTIKEEYTTKIPKASLFLKED